MLTYDNRNKDRNPLETIQWARKILSGCGILVRENWYTPQEGLFSVTLFIIGTNLYANGKGSTEFFALASGYGELMERLQNLAYFRMSPFIEKYSTNEEFYIEKNEICQKGLPEETLKYLEYVYGKENAREFFMIWNQHLANTNVISLVYRNIENSNDTLVVPDAMNMFFYGSNGMASGNTYEEAVTQGICEILERYAVKRMLVEKLTPYDITHEICKQYVNIKKIINTIEENNINILVKDLSLGLELPVYAVVYIEEKKINILLILAHILM